MNSAKEELEDLQMQQSEQKQSSNSSARRSNANWEKERQQFIEREKEYQDNLNDLQAELDELRGIDKECQRLGEEKSNLVKKCKDIFEEHQATLQGVCDVICTIYYHHRCLHCHFLILASTKQRDGTA